MQPMKPDTMAALHAACFVNPRPWTAREFTDLLRDRHIFAVPQPTGFALGRAVAGEAELLTLAVAPEARRQGTGRRLLAAFEAAARDRGATDVWLEVAEGNAPARALYAAAGYAEAGRRPRYFADGPGPAEDAVVLTRNIRAAG